MDGHDERRHNHRVDLRRPATLINSDGDACEAVLVDISKTGVRLIAEDALKIGEAVTLRVDGVEEWRVRICWCLGSEAGGILLDPRDERPSL